MEKISRKTLNGKMLGLIFVVLKIKFKNNTALPMYPCTVEKYQLVQIWSKLKSVKYCILSVNFNL